MRDTSHPDRARRRAAGSDEDRPGDEDFLYHLSRASELLVQSRVVEAKEQLELAISHRPQDSQGQDLLAGVYFRLGMYPTAIQLWRNLVDEHPDDPTLQVNLGLALIKTGQPEEAQTHLERALELEPEHARAWGYLGLALWRQGHLERSREAFLKGGQATMARRVEEEERASSAGVVAAVLAAQEDAHVAALREAAQGALDRLDAPLALAEERPRDPTGAWKVLETGVDPLPRAHTPRLEAAPRAPALSALLDEWLLSVPDGAPLAVAPEGDLHIHTDAAVHARLSGLRAVRGLLRVHAVERRHRGRADAEPLGGAHDPIVRWSGPIAAVVAPPEGLRYHAVRVDDTLLYVRERYVQAFDDHVGFESASLPLSGEPEVLLSFHGQGVVVLRLPRRPSGLLVRADDEVSVDPSALVGWTGRLFPTRIDDPEPAALALAFRGQGIVLVA